MVWLCEGKGDKVKRKWLKRTSSRFWRGPMAQRFWVCTDKTRGRWRPKAPEDADKARKGGKRKRAVSQRPARPKRASAGPGEPHVLDALTNSHLIYPCRHSAGVPCLQ